MRFGIWASLLTLAGCSALPAGLAGATPTPSVTPSPPSATPQPLAARVNGTPILLSDYQAEVARFEAAKAQLGIDLATLGDYRGQVLQALIDRRLLALGAEASGVRIDPAALDGKLEELAAEMGSNEAMGAWMAANDYSADSFRAALQEELLAAQMVSQIVAAVPSTAEQVHARHLLVATRTEAEDLLRQLATGADFAELARSYSLDLSTRPAGGDLGWFPRRYLTVPEVEAAAFDLQPGDLSAIVESSLGFHIVQTLERGERPLSPHALRHLQTLAVQDWLQTQRQTAVIEILVVP
ncbi:MAG: peptidylprolyl isomerase [Chloroflexota bacterium]